MNRVAAIVVLYHPDLELLHRNLQAITDQVDKIYLIDNTPTGNLSEWTGLNQICQYIPLHCNAGIATAQNEGIQRALENGADYVYFLDQDSVSQKGIVSSLIQYKNHLESRDIKVGAIAGLPFNEEGGRAYIPTTPSTEGVEGVTEVRELISSGSLIPLEVLKKTGGMMDELFIDEVDHEWCWRATATCGYRFFIVNHLRLNHHLGRGDRRLLWRRVAVPSPMRTYYLYRNTLLLLRKSYVPLSYKINRGVKLSLKIFYYPIFISPRREYCRYIFKGIRDGVKALFRK